MEGAMFNLASEEKYEDGKVIFQEGSPGDWVYVILSGSVKITKTVKGKLFTLSVLEPGEVFGEMSFLGGTNKRNATAWAVGETTIGVIDRQSLDEEFNKISSDFRSILVSSVKRFGVMLNRACDFATRSAPRIPKALSLAYKDRQSFIQAYTGNISSGGLSLKTENPLSPGSKFILNLQLPEGGEALKINCEVKWARKKEEGSSARPPGMGVQFGEMSTSDREKLILYLKKIGIS
jgi:CRP/FNR family cyclic AMP-dependent transcriptional regulator